MKNKLHALPLLFIISLIIQISLSGCSQSNKAVEQIAISYVDKMPNIPQPFKMKDWNKVARDFDALVYDFNAKGDFFPLIWLDKAGRNLPQDSYGIYSFMGDNRQGGETYEGIVALGSALGATLAGIDKSNQNGFNFVQMCENFMNLSNGRNVVSNGTNELDESFWYSIFPSMPFMGLLNYYPDTPKLDELAKLNSDQWYKAVLAMGGEKADFEYTCFDFQKMQPVDNGRWIEPDAAAGIAWIQYMSYCKWKDQKYKDAAKWCMDYLQKLDPMNNPFYEVLLPYGVYISARMNAEQSTSYNTEKFFKWIFDGLATRPAWGVINERWGNMDAHGLQGSMTDNGGYAFTMNTFNLAMPLVPMVKYDQSYSRVVGKWLLNAVNNARMFYPDEWPDDQQTCPEYKSLTKNVIAYEGLVKKWGLESPYAMGDARKYGWARTDFGLYGSSYVGIFGGIISKTTDEKILQLDCNKTDFFAENSYPTYLYYNPYDTQKTIEINVGEGKKKLYDLVSRKFIAKGVQTKAKVTIPGDNASLIVIVPYEGKVKKKDGKLYVNDVVVDYHYEG